MLLIQSAAQAARNITEFIHDVVTKLIKDAIIRRNYQDWIKRCFCFLNFYCAVIIMGNSTSDRLERDFYAGLFLLILLS